MEQANENYIKIDKLNNTNYMSWSYRSKLILEEKDWWKAVETDAPVGEANDPNVVSWNTANRKAKTYISLNVEDAQLAHIKSCKSSKEIWKN